jgi:hypothetical protein
VSTEALTVENDNLSIAWATAMLRLLDKGIEELSPLVVTILMDGDEPKETAEIRQALDEELELHGFSSCATTANTIFPKSLWVPSAGYPLLFERYTRILPQLKQCREKNRCPNQHGLYFERMVAHGAGKVNQLQHIIETYKGGNHRRSALQVSILDPAQDHTHSRQRGFPCLQQVGFAPGADGLTVTGYYPTQNIFDRAYGNYLGLCRLGLFMAHELNLKLVRLNCFVGVGKLEKVNKGELNEFAATLRQFTVSNGT